MVALRSSLILILLLFVSTSLATDNNYDVTVVGYVLFPNGLGRNTIAALDYLQDSLSMNYICTRPTAHSLEDVPENVKALLVKNDRTPSNIAILYDVLASPKDQTYKKVPASHIKLAYSMIESTKVPNEWPSIINNHFDAVVVPDPFLVEVYKNCGVKKPIFVLPHPVYIDEFLAKPAKIQRNNTFTFGVSSSPSSHKNTELLVDAFIREFGNRAAVKLKIHVTGKSTSTSRIQKKIRSAKIHNIELQTQSIRWAEYIQFMSSLDCYVLVSKGEGFSVTPREAMALGIPCILSNNTAHKTLCNSGFVYAVKSDIMQAHEDRFIGGYNFNCRIEDVQNALRDMHHNYEHYLAKAQAGREWVKQYHGYSLKPKYLNLFKPKKVILGKDNQITDDFLMTSDASLYSKYASISKTDSSVQEQIIQTS